MREFAAEPGGAGMKYGRAARILHWLCALLALGLAGLGAWMTELDYYHPLQMSALDWHRSLGMIALALGFARVGWRAAGALGMDAGYPPPLAELRRWEVWGSRAAHWILFALLLVVPATGYMISTSSGAGVSVFGWIEIPALLAMKDSRELLEAAHWWSAYGMVALAAIHAGAALKHHFIDGNDALRRML